MYTYCLFVYIYIYIERERERSAFLRRSSYVSVAGRYALPTRARAPGGESFERPEKVRRFEYDSL